ncbi:MAG: autotransporter domain-containing protein [Alphaproteobacteria bacterium]|nr:autotransporter domain-containing protein [Alphaproteobacteria bacterium]
MIRQSKTTLKELSAQYRSVLKKCALLNAMALVSVAVAAPAGASEVPFLTKNDQVLSGTYSNYTNTDKTLAGVATINYDTTGVRIADNTTFTNNATQNSTSAGGAIKALNGFTGGDGIKFNGNEAFDDAWGGGAMYIKLANGTTASQTDSVQLGENAEFIGNKSNVGGAIALEYGNLTIGEGTIFDSNTATDGDKQRGGAIAMWRDAGPEDKHSTLTLNGVSFKNNQAGSLGGAIFNEDPNATVTINENSSFKNNTAKRGGAIYNAGTTTVNNSEFNKNTATQYGGAIFVASGTLDVNNSTFTENNGGVIGGAISDVFNVLNTLNINEGTTFTGNYATTGGAIGAYNAFNINGTNDNKVTFKGNHTTAVDDGGGAIVLGAHARTTINNAVFENNYANLGGAIATRPKGVEGDAAASAQDKDGHWLTISNSEFRNNRADATLVGGTNGSTYTYGGYNFINGDGGAIWNGFDGSTINGEKHENVITNSSFIGNIAANRGGAIFNKGTLNFTGTNIFSGNKANGVLNDIYNSGTLNISGDLTLDGGITGNGTIKFTDATNLVARLQNMPTINATSVTGVDKVAIAGLIAENGLSTKEYVLIDKADAVFANIADSAKENALYKFAIGTEKGSILVTRKSVAEQTAGLEKAGLDSSAAKTIAAISALKTTGNVAADALFADLTAAAQSGDTEAAETINEVAKTINPESEAVAQSAAVSTQNTINNLTAGRMDMGRNGGDLNLTSGGVWVQGLFNRAKSGDKFSANTRGISAGIDGTINNDIMLGIGYAYGHSDVSAKTRDTDIDNHSVFLYGQYKPTQWYANATLNYTTSGYKENGSVAGLLAVDSEYRANAFGANVATGYELPFGLTPELGLRYLHVRTNDYTNSLGFHTDAKNTNFLTGILGARYGFDIAASDTLLIRPELSAAAKYDLVSDGNTATVALPGVDAYTLDVERLKRFGGEFGAGLTMSYYGFDLSLTYYIDVREDYTSQTGMAKFRYNF